MPLSSLLHLLQDKHYLCVMASDTPDQNLSQYFSVCNDFIHAARLREGNVLIHCLAGMSRSVTVAVAYIMTATHLNWKEALKVVRAGRAVANPNTGFQNQLQEFEQFKLSEERRRLRERFPSSALEQLDQIKCGLALDNYQELLQNKDICEGNCSRGEKCPTGANFIPYTIDGMCVVPNNGNGSKDSPISQSMAYTIRFIVDKWRHRAQSPLDSEELTGSDDHISDDVDEEDGKSNWDDTSSTSSGESVMPNVVYYNPGTSKGRFVRNLDGEQSEQVPREPNKDRFIRRSLQKEKPYKIESVAKKPKIPSKPKSPSKRNSKTSKKSKTKN